MLSSRKLKIALADDHSMLRTAIVKLFNLFANYNIIFDVDSGEEVKKQFRNRNIPDVLILDINMSGKEEGISVAKWVNEHYPAVKILGLSMYQDETTILKMIQSGAHGYITKNCEPDKLMEAIETVYKKGVYLPADISLSLLTGIQKKDCKENLETINEKEKLFLHLLCKEFTYDQIAEQMFLSPRTIDDYRKKLARKLGVKGKSGLIVFAINNGLHIL